MILYFSGTGNSEYVAKRIAAATGDGVLNLFQKLRSGDHAPLDSKQPWVVVTPTYAWRIPRLVANWIAKTELRGSREIYFVMTCGGNIGNAGQYLKKLCAEKNLQYRGCMEVVMSENYIALFSTPTRDEAEKTIRAAQGAIAAAAAAICERRPFPEPKITPMDRISSGIVNDVFYPMFVHAKKFHATDACISCGQCVKLCPTKNIRLRDGRPVWKNRCTHCMACICRCPAEAIEYGKHSKGLPRYVFPKDFREQEEENNI